MVHHKGDDMRFTGSKMAKQSAQPASSFFDEKVSSLKTKTTKVQILQNELRKLTKRKIQYIKKVIHDSTLPV